MNIDLDIIKEILEDNDVYLGDDLFAVATNNYHKQIILVQGSENSTIVSIETYTRYKNLKDILGD